MAQLDGFTPLKMTKNPPGIPKPPGASSAYVTRENGTGFWILKGHTDLDDGITDADFVPAKAA